MDKKNKHDVVVAAVAALKSGEFKATAIKIELEAQLNRSGHYSENYTGDRCYDEDDTEYCDTCGGDEYIDHEDCGASGQVECNHCEGTGVMPNPEWNNSVGASNIGVDEEIECDACEGERTEMCLGCDRDGRISCPNEFCDGGYVPVQRDEDTGDGEQYNFGREVDCHDFILKELMPYGLAELIPEGVYYDLARKYRPVAPLMYSKFYNDHSVDSEHTFTLSLEKEENVFLLPHFVEAFKKLGEAVSGSFNVSGAGMHMALMNDKECLYPVNPTDYRPQLKNFDKSMRLLLPALYFLGSSTEDSRSLTYRQPKIATGMGGSDKYGAIRYWGGALEFRIFQTCYDNPEVLLDNIVVMQKCVKFWRKNYRSPHLDKITKEINFGNDMNDKLSRLYCTAEHVDLLNKGLRILKPSYYTIQELKEQRNFKVTKTAVKQAVTNHRKEAAIGYKEYEHRFNWNLNIRKYRYMADGLERAQRGNTSRPIEEVEAEVKVQVERDIRDYENTKEGLEPFIEERVHEFIRERRGQYVLSVEGI